jgi:hypothetical protein
MRTVPLLRLINPAMILSSVLLPQPLGPTMETNSLPAMARSTRSSAWVS